MRFISEEKALNIAKKHGHLHAQSFSKNKSGWNITTPGLDTLNNAWEIRSNKITYKSWGRTTKQYEADQRIPCKRVNDCHVIKTRTIWIDAISGKILRKEKKKKVAGNYE